MCKMVQSYLAISYTLGPILLHYLANSFSPHLILPLRCLCGRSTWSTLVNILTQSINLTYGVFMHTNLCSSPRILHLLTCTQLKLFITTRNATCLYHLLIFIAYIAMHNIDNLKKILTQSVKYRQLQDIQFPLSCLFNPTYKVVFLTSKST